jgi:hypothetical protein
MARACGTDRAGGRSQRKPAAGADGKVVQKSRTKVVNLIFGSRVLLTRPGESGAPGLMKKLPPGHRPGGVRARRERGAGPS